MLRAMLGASKRADTVGGVRMNTETSSIHESHCYCKVTTGGQACCCQCGALRLLPPEAYPTVTITTMVTRPATPRKYRDRLLAAAYVLARTERDGFDGSLQFLADADQIIEEIEQTTMSEDTRPRFTHQPAQKG